MAHKQHCSLIEQDMSGKASKDYDVNQDSILNQLSYFHVCHGKLVPDKTHDTLKSILQYEINDVTSYDQQGKYLHLLISILN